MRKFKPLPRERYKQLKKHHIYEVEFWDHSDGDYGLALSRVVGYFVNQDEISITMSYWLVTPTNPEDSTATEKNYEKYNIGKGLIFRIKRVS